MDKPYVVSTDISLLLKEWAVQHTFVLPREKFFDQLREDFSIHMSRIFPNFEFVTEDEISRGLANLVKKSGLPTISLDRVYFKSKLNLEITRLVGEDGADRGLGQRAGTSPLSQQVEDLQVKGLREVVIVDDVLYSGGVLGTIIDMLSRINVHVSLVCAGIGIVEGIRRINSMGCEVYCVRTYDEVIDEVCERDFYPGVPLSGRLLAGGDNTGVPYILPFGNPASWASIPLEHTATFSKFCLQQTVLLFEEIEKCSGKPISCRDLGRKVAGLPIDETRYTKVLGGIIKNL